MSSPEKPIAVAVAGSRGGSAKKPTTRKATPKQTVSEKELVDALADCIVVGLAAYFQYLAQVDAPDRAELEMTDDEANAIATPFAKLIERHASAQAAGFVAGSKDWIVAVAAIMAYTDRARPVLRRKAEQRRIERGQQVRQAQERKSATNGSVRQVQDPEPSVVGVPGRGYGLGVQQTID